MIVTAKKNLSTRNEKKKRKKKQEKMERVKEDKGRSKEDATLTQCHCLLLLYCHMMVQVREGVADLQGWKAAMTLMT